MSFNAIIIDDSAVSRALLKVALNKAGVKVSGEASTAERALALYEEHTPTFAIFDIVLPQTDGITAATEVLKAHPDANVVICSAIAAREKILACREAGVSQFLLKPITIQKVAEMVARHRTESHRAALPNGSTPGTALAGGLQIGSQQSCPKCQRSNDPQRRYCAGCGARLASRSSARSTATAPLCDRCSFVNTASDLFCGGCGDALISSAKRLESMPRPSKTKELPVNKGGPSDSFLPAKITQTDLNKFFDKQ